MNVGLADGDLGPRDVPVGLVGEEGLLTVRQAWGQAAGVVLHGQRELGQGDAHAAVESAGGRDTTYLGDLGARCG